jgi:hypothetical protein
MVAMDMEAQLVGVVLDAAQLHVEGPAAVIVVVEMAGVVTVGVVTAVAAVVVAVVVAVVAGV